MAVSQLIIDAYCRRYSQSQLEAALDQALADYASGVKITQVNFQEGGGTGQMIQGDPGQLIEILEIALKQKAGASKGPPPLAHSVNFSTRRSEQ